MPSGGLADIMLIKTTDPHGFGLHKTPEFGLIYINETILRNAAKAGLE